MQRRSGHPPRNVAVESRAIQHHGPERGLRDSSVDASTDSTLANDQTFAPCPSIYEKLKGRNCLSAVRGHDAATSGPLLGRRVIRSQELTSATLNTRRRFSDAPKGNPYGRLFLPLNSRYQRRALVHGCARMQIAYTAARIIQLRAQYTLYARAISEMNVIERYAELFTVSVSPFLPVARDDAAPPSPTRHPLFSSLSAPPRSLVCSIMV